MAPEFKSIVELSKLQNDKLIYCSFFMFFFITCKCTEVPAKPMIRARLGFVAEFFAFI